VKTIAIALASILTAACSASTSLEPQIETAASPSAPLAEYRTFSFGFTENPPTAYQTSARSLEVEQRMRTLICAALQAKGYVRDDAKPNFVVRFGAGIQEDTVADVELDPTWSFEDALDFGKIQIDVFDASTKTAVWRGSAISRIDLTKHMDNDLLERAVQGIFATFPKREA
jgi:uncharacterized protein DUF4136